MVSFQCEGCGDVISKKKLDPHRGQCRTASYTCLDCMTHFEGTGYRAHTSCISEDQKYQGALYKQKSSKKSVKIASTESQISRAAYVEDAPDADTGNGLSIIEAPPEAPVPPSAASEQPNVNVFDFLVTEDTPNGSKISLAPGQQHGMDYTPSVLGSEISRKHTNVEHDPEYHKRGFSYGSDAVPATHKKEQAYFEYITPASKELRKQLEKTEGKSDKKRKRLQIEELDLSVARRPSQEPSDAVMSDAPPAVLHSGLTGGLNRLLSKSKYPPSPDYSNDPPSPVKRSKSASTSQALVKKDRDRDRSKSTARSTTGGALVKVRKRRTSDESRPRKKNKHRTHSSSHDHKEEEEPSRHRRKKHRSKAIEYPPEVPEDSQQQLVVFKTRAEFFMSLVTKEEDSGRGMSMHKVLKRYHRERSEVPKEEEEKALWKGLRLRKNERGEVVVFFE